MFNNGILLKKYSLTLFILAFFALLSEYSVMIFGPGEALIGIKITITFLIFVFVALATYKEIENIMLTMFYICLFNFQFSWLFLGFFWNQPYWDIEYFGINFCYSFKEINMVLNYLLIAIFTIFIVSYRYKYKYGSQKSYAITYSTNNKIQKLSYYLILISFPFAFYAMHQQISYVLTHGYQAYFTREEPFYGFFVNQMETLYRVAFAIFLATLPSIKKLRMPLLIYIIYTFLYLGTGDRTNVAVLFFMLIWYVAERNYSTHSEHLLKINFTKRVFIVMGGLALGFIFSVWNAVRYSFGNYALNYVEVANSSPGMLDFFTNQGRSFNTVMVAQSINEARPLTAAQKAYVLLQPVFDQLYRSALNIFDTNGTYSLGGFQFAHIPSSADLLSYYTNPMLYLSGGGLGSSFIAEGVLMGGMLGVILTSIIVATSLNFLHYNSRENFWVRAFTCFAFIFLMRYPRDLTLGPLAFLMPFAIRACVIYIVALLLLKNKPLKAL